MSEKKKKHHSHKNNDMQSIKNKIVTFLKAYSKKMMPLNELQAKCGTKKSARDTFAQAFSQLRDEGIITVNRNMKVSLTSRIGLKKAEITRLSRTFGFAVTEDGTEYFIPGKCMLGAMPHDIVLVADIPSRSGEPEGEVHDILKFGSNTLTGVIRYEEGELYLVPDIASKNSLIISKSESVKYAEGDKVLAEIVYRGKRHAEHKVKITSVFGSSDSAQACAESIVMANGIVTEFSEEAFGEAVKISIAGIQSYSFNNREDLTGMNIFTIDSAESKDLDDAVSVEKTADGWLLGVHIADVSHYVKANSALDKDAMSRGTSVYYADKVIPMLPEPISNNICSLNPNEERLTLSAFMELDESGEIRNYRFCKSFIKSRVKGVYSEINRILDGSASDDILEKYADVSQEIPLMNQLADVLIKRRKERHAPELETVESKLIINYDGICCDIEPRERGKSERIIEEFMLCANEAAARLAREKNAPFVYRIHEAPPEDKIANLCEMLTKFSVEYPHFQEFKPVHACEILDSVRGTEKYEAVNMMVLRSMAKAKYSDEPVGHFGLALDDYAHFTSPIRRYSDLAVHRIITDILAGYGSEWLSGRYSGFAVKASEAATAGERRAVTCERACEDCYKAEFMKQHIGEAFTAKISSVTEFGFYVRTENSAEGLVHINTLPEGEYDYSEPVALTERFSGVSYELGKTVNVICAAVNVSDGTVDFVLDEEE